MIRVQFMAAPDRWDVYRPALEQAFAEKDLPINLAMDHPPETVDYAVFAPHGPEVDFASYTACKAVFGLWAGVEAILCNPTLTQPLARMVDPGLTEGMVEWVTGHVLRHHLGMDRHVLGQTGEWLAGSPPLARDRTVGFLGLGALGTACATALSDLNFNVSGWSRRAKSVPNVRCHSGEDGLDALLRETEILVLLLPLTAETTDVLNAERLAQLPDGAVVINPGRGALIDDKALLAALDRGQIDHATLDVFRVEPLPRDHPYWDHPKVTVTPHIASETRPGSAARTIADNIAGHEAGQPLRNLVDRTVGY